MAWLGEGFSTLKGQITNFTKEVLSDGKEDDEEPDVSTLEVQVKELKSCCESQYEEIAELRGRNEQLKISLESARVQDQTEKADLRQRNEQLRVALERAKAQVKCCEVPANHNGQRVQQLSRCSAEQAGHRTRLSPAESDTDSNAGLKKGDHQYLVHQINQLETENKAIKNICQELELQVAELSKQLDSVSKEDLLRDTRSYNNHQSITNNVADSTTDTGYFRSEDGVPHSLKVAPNNQTHINEKSEDAKEMYNELVHSRDHLLKDNECLTTEVEALASTVQDLESKLSNMMEENATLTNSLEELDQQNQLVIDQLLLAKNNVLKENEALTLELQAIKKQVKNVEVQRSVDEGTNTTEEDLYSTIKAQVEEEMLQHLLKMLTFDLPQTSGVENANSKYESLLNSVVKACEDFNWKTKTIEKQFASLINEQRELKVELKKRNYKIAKLQKQLSLMQEREMSIMKELNAARCSNSEQLEAIPESQEEIERLEQQITHLENALRETASLKEEIARLKEERAVIERQVHFTEASLHNEENVQISTGHELQQALQENGNLKVEMNKLFDKIELLEKELVNSREISEHYAETKDKYEKNMEAYQEAIKIKTQLEADLLLKQDCLQKAHKQNEELAEKNNSLLSTVKSQEEIVKKNTEDMYEKNKEAYQEAIIIKTQLEADLLLKQDCLQKAHKQNEELAEKNNSLLSTIKSQEEMIKKNTEDMYEKNKEAYQEAIIIKTQLEADLLLKQDCLQKAHKQNEELAEKNNSLLSTVKSQEEMIKKNTEDMYEKNKEAYQEAIIIKTQLEADLLLKQDCLQKAHKQNEELAEKNNSLLSTVKSQEEMIKKNTEDMYEKNKEAYQEAIIIKTQLEADLLLKQDCLQKAHKQNEELAEKNNLLLSTIKSQEEMIMKNTNIAAEYSKLQELIVLKEEELRSCQETSFELDCRLNKIEAAKAALEAENCTFVAQFKCQEEAQAHRNLQLSMLEKILENTQSELDELNKDSKLKQEELETLKTHNISLESNNNELKKYCDDLQNTCVNLKQELSELMTKNGEIIKQKVHEQEDLQSQASHLKNSLDILEKKLKIEMESNEHLKKMCASFSDELQNKQSQEQEILQLRKDCEQKEDMLQRLTNSYQMLDPKYKVEQQAFTKDEMNLESSPDVSQKQCEVCAAKTNLSEQLDTEHIVKTEDKTIQTELHLIESQSRETEADKTSHTESASAVVSEQLSKLITEREELICTVRLKHSENLKYHSEIQRLNGLLSQEIAKSQNNFALYEEEHKSLVEIEAQLVEVKQHLENLKQITGPVLSIDQECEEDRDNEDRTTDALHENNQVIQKHDIDMLQEKHAKLLEAMQQETTRNIYLQNEVQELTEKETSLLKELERLRYHLMAVEDGYTQEVVEREKEISELQSKLASAEDRIKGFNTALTSASVRANQHVETLQDQTRLIGQQRDDIQMKLSAAEDQIQRQMAALTNLQAVLEQFQRDKEQEQVTAKSHLQAELKNAEARQAATLVEVSNLQKQLLEAKEGLGAAARLGEQLDKKSQVISELKEEVNRLQNLLSTAEKREESASMNAEAKVDRYLMKNLFLGYLTAPNNTKPQTLRILSTVLDFNHEDRARAGLEPGPSSGGWLHRLLHPIPGAESNESLSEAFVRFLESESRPQPQLQLLPTVEEEQRRQSTSSASSGRSSISLAEVQLPTFTQFPVVRSSSSILKDVLKDSH